jgi:arabinofuranosyltransferase
MLGATPLVAWEMFAFVYYGTPLPNTAYAKVLGAHASAFALFRRGLFYGRATALFDPVTVAAIVLAPLAIVPRERWRDWPLLAGIVAHGLYVTYVGGDFMFGRFYTPLLVWSVALLARTPWIATGRVAAVVATGFVALGLTAPDQPALLSGYHGWTPFPRTLWFQGESVDERQHYFEYTGLLNQPSGGVHPAHPWAYQGLQLRGTGSRRVTWIDNIGFAGYFSGPHVHIIDRYGLADPLMARIPIDVTTARVGHFVRELPAGYQESIESGDNRIADPHLARFYDRLRLVVSGPIWDRRRLATIGSLLMGGYDSDIRAYTARSSPAP